MSTYAATDTGDLIVCWWSGSENCALVLTHSDAPVALMRELAGALSTLSEQCWRVYAQPIRTGGDPFNPIDIDDRQELAHLGSLVVGREMRAGDLDLFTSYIPVVEAARAVGRLLRRIGDGHLTAAVCADVQVEADAVVAANLGNLGGRAQQGVHHSRTEVSPLQVDAAWKLLEVDPLNADQLLTDYDPGAASVAAAAWLQAAAAMTAEQTQRGYILDVIRAADDIEAVPITTLEAVLELLEDHDAYRVVAHLVGEAMAVADGRVADIDSLEQALYEARSLAGQVARHEEDVDAILGEVRLCVLDPSRPAPDLLEDLLTGLWACWLVWNEYSPRDATQPEEQDDDLGDGDKEDQRRIQFCDALREWVSRTPR